MSIKLRQNVPVFGEDIFFSTFGAVGFGIYILPPRGEKYGVAAFRQKTGLHISAKSGFS
jgi:hypothetical protein